MDKEKPKTEKGKKGKINPAEEPKVAFDGTFEELMNKLAPPIKPKKKKED